MKKKPTLAGTVIRIIILKKTIDFAKAVHEYHETHKVKEEIVV